MLWVAPKGVSQQCELKFFIGFHAKFRLVESDVLVLLQGAESHEILNRPKYSEGNRTYNSDAYDDANKLHSKLRRVARKKTFHRAVYTIPPGSIPSIGKDTEREDTKCTADAMH